MSGASGKLKRGDLKGGNRGLSVDVQETCMRWVMIHSL